MRRTPQGISLQRLKAADLTYDSSKDYVQLLKDIKEAKEGSYGLDHKTAAGFYAIFPMQNVLKTVPTFLLPHPQASRLKAIPLYSVIRQPFSL